MIRRSEQADLEWLVDLACDRYGDLDRDASTTWAAGLLTSHDVIAMRGENCAAFAALYRQPWKPQEILCDLLNVFGRPKKFWDREVDELLLAIDAERVRRGAARFYITSTTVDLSPICRRIGARPVGSLHVLESEQLPS